MIQRIQTVFLSIVAILMITTFFFPLWSVFDITTDEKHELFALFHKYTLPNQTTSELEYFPFIAIGVLCLLSAGIATFSIFKYKNRLAQMKMGALNSIVMAGVLGLSVWFATDGQKAWTDGWDIPKVGDYQTGFWFVPIAMICNLMANRFIRRDEKLVQSVDRIR